MRAFREGLRSPLKERVINFDARAIEDLVKKAIEEEPYVQVLKSSIDGSNKAFNANNFTRNKNNSDINWNNFSQNRNNTSFSRRDWRNENSVGNNGGRINRY